MRVPFIHRHHEWVIGSMADQTFLFADLSGFTALTEVHGDEQAVEFATEFSAAVRGFLADYSAEEVKTIGDAIMIRCPEAGKAIRLGLRIVQEVGGRPGFPTVRVGMDTGPAIERNGDWFGATVNLAARVAGTARGGEVILTEMTRVASGQLDDLTLRELGRRSLRNIAHPVSLFEARAEATRLVGELPIDPVCRMAVDPSHSAGHLIHDGIAYHFCSLGCAGKFAADPGLYATRESDSARLRR
jgi:adenylate cyclase